MTQVRQNPAAIENRRETAEGLKLSGSHAWTGCASSSSATTTRRTLAALLEGNLWDPETVIPCCYGNWRRGIGIGTHSNTTGLN